MPKKHQKSFSLPTDTQKDFLDMISPSVIKFHVDHFICGNTFRSVYALREYPTATNELEPQAFVIGFDF